MMNEEKFKCEVEETASGKVEKNRSVSISTKERDFRMVDLDKY